MRYLVLTFLWVCFSIIAWAQEPVFSAQFLENELFEPTSVQVLHVEPMPDSILVAIEITMRGAIQKRNGSFMSGGGDLETLKATYIYILDHEGKEMTKEVHWLEPRKAPKSFNILIMSALEPNYKFIATEENALSNSDYRRLQFKRVLKMSDEDLSAAMNGTIDEFFEDFTSPLQDLKGFFEEEEFKGDNLPDAVYKTEPIMSAFGGKLKKVRTTHYTKRPNGGSSILTGRYEIKEMETYKVDMEDLFDNDKKRFTLSNHTVRDPISGNAMIYAGVKIKKDKSEKDNKYFEHILLTYDRAGKLKKKVVLNNEEPWGVGTGKLIGAESFAKIIDPAFDHLFIAQNPPKKAWVKNPNQQRFLILNKEGEIVLSEVVPSVSHGSKLLQRASPINDSVVVVNTYAPAEPHPFAGIYTLDPRTGLLDQKILQTGAENAQAVPFIPTSSAKRIRNKMHYLAEDGSRYLLDMLIVKGTKATSTQPGQPARYYNYLFYRVNPDGTLSNVAVLERSFDSYTEAMEVEFLNENEDAFYIKLTERQDGQAYLKMATVQKADMSVSSFSLPFPLLDEKSVYTGEDHTYFMVKDESGLIRLLSY